jgi:Response regulator receiver domain
MYLKPYRPEAPGILSAVGELRESGASHESPITVVIADDHPVILEGLVKILNSQKDIRVVASATDGEEVSKLYYQFLPDVLILDRSRTLDSPIIAKKLGDVVSKLIPKEEDLNSESGKRPVHKTLQ